MRIIRQSQVLTAPPGWSKKHGQPCTGRHGADRGTYLLVSADGRGRRWVFRFIKPSTGRVSEHGIGDANLLSLQEARDLALELRRDIAKGIDPVERRREQRRAKTTFADIVTLYLDLMKPVWRSEKHYANTRRLLTNQASPLANKAVAHITNDDIEMCLRPTWTKSPDMGRRTLAAITQVLDLAVSHGHCERNPADWRLLKRRFPTRHKTKHHAAIDYAQLPDFVRRLHIEQERDDVLSPFVLEFLVLTGGRAGEVCGMKRDEVDFPNKVWTIPASRRKKGEREHRVPLSTRALELLARQRQRTNGEYVWPGVRGKRPISTKSVYLYLVRTMGVPVTIHGFRSSFRDWCGNETATDRVTAELALGHKAGDATELAYRRSDALEKRRILMQAWADFCLGAAPL